MIGKITDPTSRQEVWGIPFFKVNESIDQFAPQKNNTDRKSN